MVRLALILGASVALAWSGVATADIPPPRPRPAPAPAPKPDDGAVKPDEGAVKPDDGEKKPDDEAERGGEEAPKRIVLAPGPPDGTFGGTLATATGDVQVRLVVVGGLLVHGEARLPDGRALALEAAGALDSQHLRLGGRDGREYLQIRVELFDAERGRGEFNGVLGKKRLEGQWTAERR